MVDRLPRLVRVEVRHALGLGVTPAASTYSAFGINSLLMPGTLDSGTTPAAGSFALRGLEWIVRWPVYIRTD